LPGRVVAQLANTPWPMFHMNLQHTGKSPFLEHKQVMSSGLIPQVEGLGIPLRL